MKTNENLFNARNSIWSLSSITILWVRNGNTLENGDKIVASHAQNEKTIKIPFSKIAHFDM